MLSSWQNLIKVLVVSTAVSGWVIWGMGTFEKSHVVQENLELAELNRVLLSDVHDIQLKYKELREMREIARKPPVIQFDEKKLEQGIIASLENRNRSIVEKLDDFYSKFQRDLKEVMKTRMAKITPDLPKAKSEPVRLGTLSVSANGASYQTPAKESQLTQISRAPELKKGKIISVDKKDNFVIIDIGEQAGVEQGMRLLAQRGNQKLADLQVIESRNSISACNVDCLTPGCTLKVDDVVLLSGL
jgi:hypothetical protein